MRSGAGGGRITERESLKSSALPPSRQGPSNRDAELW